MKSYWVYILTSRPRTLLLRMDHRVKPGSDEV